MADKSRFVLNFDSSATEANGRPNLKGEYRLAAEEATVTLALWGGNSKKTGKLYARGQATPATISDRLRAKGAAQDVEAPPQVELKVGEAVLFENDKATKENKWPQFRGYAREADRYVKLSGWEHGNSITGDAEIYVPRREDNAEIPERPEDSFTPERGDEPTVS